MSSGGVPGQVARSVPLSLQVLRSRLRRSHRHGAVRASPQGVVTVLRRIACQGRNGPRGSGVLRDCTDPGVPLAPPLPGGGSADAGPTRRDRRGRRDFRPRELQRRARTEPQAAVIASDALQVSDARRCHRPAAAALGKRPVPRACLASARTRLQIAN